MPLLTHSHPAPPKAHCVLTFTDREARLYKGRWGHGDPGTVKGLAGRQTDRAHCFAFEYPHFPTRMSPSTLRALEQGTALPGFATN